MIDICRCAIWKSVDLKREREKEIDSIRFQSFSHENITAPNALDNFATVPEDSRRVVRL